MRGWSRNRRRDSQGSRGDLSEPFERFWIPCSRESLGLGASFLVRSSSLVRPWSLVHAGQRTKDRRTLDGPRTKNQEPRTKTVPTAQGRQLQRIDKCSSLGREGCVRFGQKDEFGR